MTVANIMPLLSTIWIQTFFSTSLFFAGVTLQNLDKSICIGFRVDGLDYFDGVAKSARYDPIVDC